MVCWLTSYVHFGYFIGWVSFIMVASFSITGRKNKPLPPKTRSVIASVV